MAVMRWDPWRELAQLRSAMDRVVDDSFSRSGSAWEVGVPATDVLVGDDELTVKMALPGFKPEEVEITTTADALLVRGETRKETEEKQDRYLRREIQTGRFSRSVALPFPVESERAEASFDNGMLTIRLPKSEAVKPKKISIGNHANAKTVEPAEPKKG